MSRKKIEPKYPISTSTEEKEKEFEEQNIEQIGRDSKDESPTTQTIITANNAVYTERMLLERLEETGLLDDYLGSKEVRARTALWVESFSRDDLIQIFATFPAVFEYSNTQMSKTLGLAIKDVILFNDMFCKLFENILQKAKNIHLLHGWGFSEGTAEFDEFEFAVSLFYTFVEEDAHISPKEPSLCKALDEFADSNFVNLNNAGLPSIYTQLYKIVHDGHCSAGFSEQLSRIYTAIMLARAALFYGNVLQTPLSENTREQRNSPRLWDYNQAASFFKMKKELKKEMDSPLYHGDIDTEATKRPLTNPGDYLARYSSSQELYYITILLDGSNRYNKIVLNVPIPIDKVDSWITKPMENREEIEGYIKELLMQQSGKIKSFIDTFLRNENYSPVFNSLCSADIRNASPSLS